MANFKANTDPSRKLLDEMMADLELTAKQQLEMHRSLAGIFSGVSLSHSRQKNIELLRANWADKAHWKYKSYALLYQHQSVDEYIVMRVSEVRTKKQAKN